MFSGPHWAYVLKIVPYIIEVDCFIMFGLPLKGGALYWPMMIGLPHKACTLHNGVRFPCHS